MTCFKCGCEQGMEAQFCRQCGAPMPVAAGAPGNHQGSPYPQPYAIQSTRVQQHLQPLGIMWCIFGVYRLVAVAVGGMFLHSMMQGGMFDGMPTVAFHAMRAFAPVIVLMTITMSGAAILTGYALLTRRPWGRVLAIVFGILALLKLPFGTALGIYTLWVLAPQASGAEWDAISAGER